MITPQELFEVFKQAHGAAGVELDDTWANIELPEREGWIAVAEYVNENTKVYPPPPPDQPC
jgi:hypothetical protein